MIKADFNTFSGLVDKYFNDSIGFGQHKTLAINLLKQTMDILNEFNINHCLISGTLLGFARHKDFIPWDDDIDLLVDSSIKDKLPEIMAKYERLFTFMGIVINSEKAIIKMCFTNTGIEMKTDNHGFKNKILNKEGKYNWPFIDLFTYSTSEDGNSIRFFNKDWESSRMLPFETTSFLNLDVNTPKDYDYFLKSNYGQEYMTRLISNGYIHKNEEKLDISKIVSVDIQGYNIVKSLNGTQNG